MSAKLESLLRYCVSNGRVCPGPQQWDKLWKLLPDRRRGVSGWEPPAPKILSSWWVTDDRGKSICLEEQVRWANEHGVLDKVDAYLRSLTVDEWHIAGQGMTGGRIQASSVTIDQIEAYRTTLYQIDGESPITIRVGENCQALDDLLDNFGESGAAFVTSQNPYSQLLSAEENRKRQEALRNQCERYGWQVMDGAGCDPDGKWPAELSFLVIGPGRSNAENIGRMHEQHAIVWIERGRPAELVLLSPVEHI